MKKFDVAVLGAGPGGYETAIKCARYGLLTALIEYRELGGTCLNRGCIPTKALLHGAEVYTAFQGASALGIAAGEPVLDYTALSAYKNRIVEKLRKGIENSEKSYGVAVVPGFGVLLDNHTIDVGGTPLSADKIILATGSAPAVPPITGIDGKNILTSDQVLEMTACPDSFVIIGGGVIGIEFATLFSSLGKKVAVVEMLPSILPGVDEEIVKLTVRLLAKKGVDIYTNAKVASVQGGDTVQVSFSRDGKALSCSGACCIVATGRRAQTEDMGLEHVGIRTNRGFVEVDSHMRTPVSNIYAIGDITGKMQLAHVASAQGAVAAANCAGHDRTMRYEAIPVCIYTSPEIAMTGLSAREASESGRQISTTIGHVAKNGKASLMGEPYGMTKIVYDAQTGEILGAQIMAPRATDMIAEICAVMKCEGTIEELADTVHPHPTISEIVMEAACEAIGFNRY